MPTSPHPPTPDPEPDGLQPIAEIIAELLPDEAQDDFRAGLAEIERDGTTVLGQRPVDLVQFLHDWYWTAVSLYVPDGD